MLISTQQYIGRDSCFHIKKANSLTKMPLYTQESCAFQCELSVDIKMTNLHNTCSYYEQLRTCYSKQLGTNVS